MSTGHILQFLLMSIAAVLLTLYHGHLTGLSVKTGDQISPAIAKLDDKRYQATAQGISSAKLRPFHDRKPSGPRYDISERIPLISRRTSFIHNAVGMEQYPFSKWNGLITKSTIFAGEIVLVEYPVLVFGSQADSASMQFRFRQAAMQRYKSESEFRRVWPSSDVTRGFDHLVRLKMYGTDSNQQQSLYGAYQLFSGIQFGRDPNVAVMFAPKQNEFACIVMAMRDIHSGSKLVSSKITELRRGLVSGDMPLQYSNLMQQFIDSGEIFQMMNGVRTQSDWTGPRFLEKAACALHKKQIINPKWMKWCKHIRDLS